MKEKDERNDDKKKSLRPSCESESSFRELLNKDEKEEETIERT